MPDPIAPTDLGSNVAGTREAVPTTCCGCAAQMTPQFPDHPTSYQFDNALWIGFHGGYGMFIDDLLDEPTTVLPGAGKEAVLCHTCAHALCDAVPWIAALLDPGFSHSHPVTTNWTGHTGWDLPHDQETDR